MAGRLQNHKGYQGFGANVAPSIVSFHWGGNAAAPADAPQGGEQYFADWDRALNDPNATIQRARAYIKETGQKSEMVLNEFIREWQWWLASPPSFWFCASLCVLSCLPC